MKDSFVWAVILATLLFAVAIIEDSTPTAAAGASFMVSAAIIRRPR